jgi:hypothetical protein
MPIYLTPEYEGLEFNPDDQSLEQLSWENGSWVIPDGSIAEGVFKKDDEYSGPNRFDGLPKRVRIVSYGNSEGAYYTIDQDDQSILVWDMIGQPICVDGFTLSFEPRVADVSFEGTPLYSEPATIYRGNQY